MRSWSCPGRARFASDEGVGDTDLADSAGEEAESTQRIQVTVFATLAMSPTTRPNSRLTRGP
jgi:hypothetical protein